MICERHLQDLRDSGLVENTIKEAGLYCDSQESVTKILGFNPGCGGLVIPYPKRGDQPPFYRVKPDVPPVVNGKPAKYLSPKGSGNHLYIPPQMPMEVLQSVRSTLLIVEGEKKALKAIQEGMTPCLALSGVWSWKHRNGDGSKPIPDLDSIWLKKRRVFIVFDSDLTVNSQVKEAERAFAKELRRRGAIVEAIRIPPGPEGQKRGLDDYLLTHSPETFWDLPTDPISDTEERRILTLDEFMTIPFPPITSLVGDGVISAGSLDSIVGRAKLGKTWFTTQAALSVAGMTPHFISRHLPVHRSGRVLYINAEVAEPIFQRRLGLILADAKNRGFNVDEPRRNFFPVTVRGNLRIDRKDGERELLKLVEKVNPILIVLDPIGPLHYGDESKQQDVGKLLNFLLSVVNYFGAAMIVVHHMGKSTENREEIHFGRGSSVWGDRVDSNLNLTPYGEQPDGGIRLKLSFTLRNGPPLEPLIVTRSRGEFLFRAVDQTDDVVEWLEELLQAEGRLEREKAWERYISSGRRGERAFKEALNTLEVQGKMKREKEGFPKKTFLTLYSQDTRLENTFSLGKINSQTVRTGG